MKYSLQSWKLAACALTFAACAPSVDQQNFAFKPAPAAEQSKVVVRNDYFGHLDIFAVNGYMQTRIGSVRPGATEVFAIPRALLARPEIQFQVDPVGPVPPFTYRPIPLTPGNNVELAVAAALQMSSYAIVIAPK